MNRRGAEDFAAVEAIFGSALEIGDPDGRRRFIEQATADAPGLRGEVLSLVAADAAGARLFGEDAAAEAVAAGLEGKRVGPYLVGEEIGRGGMATVYQARRADGELEQTVAIKVVQGASAEQRARFRAERQTLVALRHPFIVAPLDAGTLDDGRPYLVLEKVDGQPLLDYVERQALGLEERLLIFEQICQAVAHAHGRLVVHRDLKPANILVDREGQPRLLDFGIAKLLGATDDAGAPFTPRYAAPEQVRGEPAATGSDVFSLGVVLFELLTLQKAEAMESPSAAARRQGDPLAARLAGDLDAIVARARHPDPARRYPSAEALRADLECRRRHFPVRARAPEPTYLAGRFVRRHRWPLAAAVVVAGLLVAAALVSRRAEQRAVASEAIAWRAHAEAAWVTTRLADIVAELARGESGREEALAVLSETEKLLRQADGSAPEAEARLRHALARAYAELGRRDEALVHARRAAELARHTRGLGEQDLQANLDLLKKLSPGEQ